MKIIYKEVREPLKDHLTPVFLSDETIALRKTKILKKMNQKNLDKLVIYGDVEHGSNFEYLVGFFPRFEEALLIVDKGGEVTLALGNENLNKADKARVDVNKVHVSLFSLPNQPNRKDLGFIDILKEANIQENQKIGIVGWKLFTSELEDNSNMFDIPSFIVDSIKKIVGNDSFVTNETALFIGHDGVRTKSNANEIAHYEYGASLASDCILDAMNTVDEGISELEIGDKLVRYGQHTSIVTIASSGERFIKGNMFPRDNVVRKGDPISLTVGYRGGASSRAGIAVKHGDELPNNQKDYLNRVAIPYFKGYVTWLEQLKIGMTGSDMFKVIDKALPRDNYGWSLCPGHLTADEEWMSSPIYEGSSEKIVSGMLFQVDIIPSVKGYPGVNAESTILVADDILKKSIILEYPEMWKRMKKRKEYLKNELGIDLSDDVLPMCNSVAYLRPFLLDKTKALLKE